MELCIANPELLNVLEGVDSRGILIKYFKQKASDIINCKNFKLHLFDFKMFFCRLTSEIGSITMIIEITHWNQPKRTLVL